VRRSINTDMVERIRLSVMLCPNLPFGKTDPRKGETAKG